MSWCRSRPSTRAPSCGAASRRRPGSTGRATSCTSRSSTTAPTRPPSSPARWWPSSRRGASISWPCSAPTAAASRAAPCTRRCRRRRTTTSPSSTSTTCRRPTSCAAACGRSSWPSRSSAFVQARFDFLNPHENALTEMQMVTLDAHLGIEQATRCWAGHPLPFNGTCGIWQRAAIEAGGGWKGDTVTEDLDLTYRGWVKGWRALFLTSVAVPGELPADTKTWLRQQQRWQDGFRHVSLRMFPAILKSRDITPSAKAAALLHLCMSLNQPVLLVGVVSGLLAALLAPSLVPLLLTLFLRDPGLGAALRHDLPARRPQFHPRRRDAAGALRPGAAALRRRSGGDAGALARRPCQEGDEPAQAGRLRPHAQEWRLRRARSRAAADGGRSASRRRSRSGRRTAGE